MTLEMIGWIGSLCLGICAVPEAVGAIRFKFTGCGWGLLGFWFVGEIFVTIYTVAALGWNPLILNYLLNIICLSIIIYYKVKGVNHEGKVRVQYRGIKEDNPALQKETKV